MQRDIHADAPPSGATRSPWAPRARHIAAGAVLGGSGFAAASVAGIAGVHLVGQATGLQVRAGDEPRVWVSNPSDGSRFHGSDRRQLPCGDINLWGDDIEHGRGTYRVVSEEPTGHDRRILEGTWQYERREDGRQVLAVLPGPALVNAAQATGAMPHGTKGFRFAVQVRHAHVDDERHFWIAACPPPAVPPPAAVSAAHVARRAAVPSTGVGGNELGGLLLVTAGGGCLGAAAAAARRDRGSAAAAHGTVRVVGEVGALSTVRPWHVHAVAAAAALRACGDGLAAALPGRRLAAAAVAVALTGVVAGPGRDATIGAARTLASRVEQLVAPPSPPARVVPVEVDTGSSAAGDPEMTNLDYPFPAGSRPGR